MPRIIPLIGIFLFFSSLGTSAQMQSFKEMEASFLQRKTEQEKSRTIENWVIQRFTISEELGMRSLDTIFANLPDYFKVTAGSIILDKFAYGLSENANAAILDSCYNISVRIDSIGWQARFLRDFQGTKLGSYKGELDSAYRLCEKIKDEYGMASITLFQGNYYLHNPPIDSAIYYYNKSLAFYLKTYYGSGADPCGDLLANIALVYFKKGDIDSALYYDYKSYQAYAHKDYVGYKLTLRDMSNTYKVMGKYDSAVHYLQLIEESLKDFKDPSVENSLFRSYSYLYSDVKDFEKAYANARQYLNIAIFTKDTVQLSDAFNTIAYIKYLQHQNDSALYYSNLGIALLKPGIKTNDLYVAALFLQHGINWLNIKKYDSAHYYLKQAYAKDSANGASISKARDLYYMATLYSRQHDTAKAYSHLVAAKNLLKPVTDIALAADIYKMLSACAFALRKTDEAWQYQNTYIAINDSLNKFQNIYALGELDVKYKLSEEKSQLDVLKLESRQKTIWMLLSVGAAVFIIGLILVYTRFQQNKSALQVKLLEQKAIRAQLNPHFIFNVLQSVKNEYEIDMERGGIFLSNVSVLIRSVLNLSDVTETSLAEEVALVQKYLEIESRRFEKNYTLTVHTAENINTDEITVPSLILQPLAENVVKHGEQATDVLLNIYKESKALIIEVESGIKEGGNFDDATDNTKHKGMGLKLTAERIELFNKKYKAKGGIQLIKKENNILTATITLAYV